MKKNPYLNNGIYVKPTQVTVGDNIKLSYDGLLAKSGANEVYAHIGYGNRWDDIRDFKMIKTNTGFETNISVTKPESLNICFKDNINNWDNNSGMNYTFEIMT